MDWKEFIKRDRELVDQYNEYRADCAEHELQIAINHKNMAKIDINRADLLREWEDSKAPMQRNLQGEVIK